MAMSTSGTVDVVYFSFVPKSSGLHKTPLRINGERGYIKAVGYVRPPVLPLCLPLSTLYGQSQAIIVDVLNDVRLSNQTVGLFNFERSPFVPSLAMPTLLGDRSIDRYEVGECRIQAG